MKKSEIIKKLKDIKNNIDNKDIDCCMDEEDWIIHYDKILLRIQETIDEILKKERKI